MPPARKFPAAGVAAIAAAPSCPAGFALLATRNSPRWSRKRSSAIPTSRRPPRAAVRVAASSLYPRIAMKGLGERQGQELGGDSGRGINPPDLGSPGTENSGGGGLDTSMDSSSQR